MKLNNVEAANPIQQPKISGMRLEDGVQNKNISQVTEMEKATLPVSEKSIVDAIQKANRAMEGFAHTSLEYSVHEKTHAIVVKIINNDTKEVIKEIPPEKMLDLVANLMELSGIMIDERR